MRPYLFAFFFALPRRLKSFFLPSLERCAAARGRAQRAARNDTRQFYRVTNSRLLQLNSARMIAGCPERGSTRNAAAHARHGDSAIRSKFPANNRARRSASFRFSSVPSGIAAGSGWKAALFLKDAFDGRARASGKHTHNRSNNRAPNSRRKQVCICAGDDSHYDKQTAIITVFLFRDKEPRTFHSRKYN